MKILCDSCSDLVFFFFFFSCSISRQTQLFLKLEDFFWREHLSKLALPYGIKGSGMLIWRYPLLFLLSLNSTSPIVASRSFQRLISLTSPPRAAATESSRCDCKLSGASQHRKVSVSMLETTWNMQTQTQHSPVLQCNTLTLQCLRY